MKQRTIARVWMCLAALASLVFLRAPAPGQSMSMSVARPQESFRPEVTSRDIGIISRVLNLGTSEREAVSALHDGYLAALKSKSDDVVESMQERIEKAQAMGDWTSAQATEEESAKWAHEGEVLRDGFFADLKSLLSKEQSDRWPLVERELRRFKKIGAGRLAGESVDVIRVVDEVVPDAWSKPAIAEALGNYAARLDPLLQRRSSEVGSEKTEAFNAALKADKAEAQRIFASALASRIKVRDLNLATVDEIASLLSEGDGERVRRKVFELSFPSLLKKSRSESFIRAAGSLDTLSADQRESMKGIIDRYERDLWSVLREMAAVVREKDLKTKPVQLGDSAMRTATTDTGEMITFMSSSDIKVDPKDPMTMLRVKRFELDRDTKRKVMSVLNEHQAQACSQPTIDQLYFGEDSVWGL